MKEFNCNFCKLKINMDVEDINFCPNCGADLNKNVRHFKDVNSYLANRIVKQYENSMAYSDLKNLI